LVEAGDVAEVVVALDEQEERAELHQTLVEAGDVAEVVVALDEQEVLRVQTLEMKDRVIPVGVTELVLDRVVKELSALEKKRRFVQFGNEGSALKRARFGDVTPGFADSSVANRARVWENITPAYAGAAGDITPGFADSSVASQASVWGDITPAYAGAAGDLTPSYAGAAGDITPAYAGAAGDITPAYS
jgi:hypothetical protein